MYSTQTLKLSWKQRQLWIEGAAVPQGRLHSEGLSAHSSLHGQTGRHKKAYGICVGCQWTPSPVLTATCKREARLAAGVIDTSSQVDFCDGGN